MTTPIITAVFSQKGGVAKTTTTYSLGAALAETGKKVLLIDLDPQGNLTLASGHEPNKIESGSAEILLDGIQLLGTIKDTNTENLKIIPASARLSQVETFLPVRTNYLFTLKSSLEQAKLDEYDFVIIDCPPVAGASTMNALTAASLLIIPTQAEYFSAYALRDMMTMIRRVRRETNAELAYRILITMLDQRNRAHRSIREQLLQTFGSGLFNTIIEIDTRLRESPILGLPITQYKPNSRGSLQYKALAQELIDHVK